MPFDSTLETVDRSLQAREATLRTLKFHLERAQCRMKNQANRKRTDKSYVVGDMVYFKLQPYMRLSLKDHSFQKLSAKFYGPFKVLARVRDVAYTLDLPPDSSMDKDDAIEALRIQS